MRKEPLNPPLEGPEIFKRPAWLHKDILRKELVLIKYFENREVRMSYILDFIPWSYRDIVCICDDFGVGTKKCPKCNKYARWKFMRSCRTCGNPFIRDFYHPEDKGSVCFDCLVEKYGLLNGVNNVTVKPKALPDIDAEGVYDIPAVPTFEL